MAGDHGPTKKSIGKVLGILAVITVIELGAFYTVRESLSKIGFNSLMIILSLVKCYFIVGEFMHMKYEKKSFVFYTIIGVAFLFWFIGAVLWEGSWWQSVRETVDFL